MSKLSTAMLTAPAPPIARVPGHQPECFDGCGNYRSCAPSCPASIAWGHPQTRETAYASYDREMAEWRAELDTSRDATDASEKQDK